jgi:OmcA/MtrC family decaheme c-type cytochrome
MKFSSARGLARSRVPLIAMLALAASIGLAGCEGDNGSAGPEGPSGGDGGTGPTGPTGPADVPITLGGDVKDVGTGAGLTAQQIADIGTFIATIDSAAMASNKAVIEFTLKTPQGGKVLGLAPTTLRLGIAKLLPAAEGLPSRWQSYINRSAAPSITSPKLTSAIQANTESGVAAGWTELGAGRYRYTSAVDLSKVTTPIAVTYEPSLTHRVSLAIDLSGSLGQRELAPDNPFKDFVPNGGTATSKLVATTANCAGCHVRFGEHGGPRRSVEYCVVCHNSATIDPDSGESVDMAYMAHSIHRGEDRDTAYVVYGFNGTKFDKGDVTYPQPASFCETCHAASASTPQGDDWKSSPSASACGGCHDAGLNKTGPSATTGRYTYTFTHPVGTLPPDFLTFNDGDCKGCHKPGGSGGDILEVHKQDEDRKAIENGDLFTYKILKVENAEVGKQPKVTFQILGADGKPIDVKAITTGRLRLDFAWTGKDLHNIADIAGDKYAANRGAAITIDLITSMASVVNEGSGAYSYTLAAPLPTGFSDATLGTGLMVVLEGRRQMPDGSEAYPDSAYAFAGGAARTKLVDQAKCETCHKKVAIHGGSRAGDPIICTACHNSSVGGEWLASNGVTVEDFGPIALGAFIHNLHASQVAALDPVTYPQSLARCTACHIDEKVYGARTNALPITVNAGTTASSGAATLAWKDDLADSATAGTCKGCHTTDPATAQAAIDHMKGQGGYFGLPKTLTPTSSVEGCPVCHGDGRTFDVAKAHCDALPYGECTD